MRSIVSTILQHVPNPFAILLIIAGAWAIGWDARKSRFQGNYRDERFSRLFGYTYIGIGAVIWVARQVWE